MPAGNALAALAAIVTIWLSHFELAEDELQNLFRVLERTLRDVLSPMVAMTLLS